jgi:dTDP-4-amino-4,6-dideoxygalactose transaminase
MVNSGTSALHLAYILAGIKAGDKVITTPLTCSATCHPLKQLGAEIIFADVRRDTLTLDPEDVKRKLRHHKNIKAIVVVHLGGLVVDSHQFRNIKRSFYVKLIEDAAQALGANKVGEFADYVCYSFQAIKTLSTGDGGMLCVKNTHDYRRAKKLRWFGIDREAKATRGWQAWDRRGITFDQDEVGYKYQATDIDASIGLAALKTFNQSYQRRKKLFEIYRRELKDCPKVELLKEGDSNAYWLFMVKVKGDRDAFAAKLLEKGIDTNVAHLRNDLFTFLGHRRQSLHAMNDLEFKYLCLPLNDRLSAADVKYVCKVIKEDV